MPWTCEKTHRCAGSLRCEVSIRKNAAQSSWGKPGAYHGWTIWNRRYDPEYDSYHEMNIGTIAFCPFCGERLEV